MREIIYTFLVFITLSLGSTDIFAQDNKISQSNEPIYEINEVDTKAIILSKPKAEYTKEARQNVVTGAVLLEVILSSTGEVKGIKVLSQLPHGLTDKAIEAVQMVKFKPAVKDGRSVSQRVKFEYNFDVYRLFVGNRSTGVYYDDNCSNYSNIPLSDRIGFVSRQEAKKAGYKKAKNKCP